MPAEESIVEDAARRAAFGQRARTRASHTLARYGEAYALVALTIAIALFFSLWSKTSEVFPTAANFDAIAGSQAVLSILALAVLVPLICGEYDLSVGASLGLSVVASAKAMASGWPLGAAIVAGVGIGASLGMLNGVLVVVARVNAVIVTLGTSIVAAGTITAWSNGVTIQEGISQPLIDFATETTFGVPRILSAVLAVGLLVYYVLEHTPLGRHLYMVGSNRDAARLVGLSPEWLLWVGFVAAGALGGLAGVLQLGRTGAADPQVGPTLLLPALGAAFLSAAAIRPGRFNVGGALVAIAFLAVLGGGLTLADAPNYVNDWVNGAALVAGVALAGLLGRRRAEA